MIVVDSSAFIDYYRADGIEELQNAVAVAISEDRVAVNGIIQVEICAFASNVRERDQLASDFQAFHWLDLRQPDFELAVELGVECRRNGLTIPSTDLIIAASAVGAEAELLHRDAHFDQIAQYSELRARSFVP